MRTEPALRLVSIVISEISAASSPSSASRCSSPGTSSVSILTVGETKTIKQFRLGEGEQEEGHGAEGKGTAASGGKGGEGGGSRKVVGTERSSFNLDWLVKCVTVSRETADHQQVWVGTGSVPAKVVLVDLAKQVVLRALEVWTKCCIHPSVCLRIRVCCVIIIISLVCTYIFLSVIRSSGTLGRSLRCAAC